LGFELQLGARSRRVPQRGFGPRSGQHEDRLRRADSRFFDDGLLTFLEEEKLPCIVVARLTAAVRRSCAGLKEWTALDENMPSVKFGYNCHSRTTQRRFVVLRERVREGKSAVGRVLLEVPGCT